MTRLLAGALALLVGAACPGSGGKGGGGGPTPPEGADARVGDDRDDGEEERVRAATAALGASQAALHRCWERAAADDFRLAGELVLRVTAAAGGAVASVDVLSDAPKDPVLTGCVLEVVEAWSLPAFGEGESIELPVAFQAPGAQYTVRASDAPARSLGEGLGEARVLVDRASTDATQASLSLLSFPGNVTLDPHAHPVTEVLYVLEGSARVTSAADAKGTEVKAGDAVYVKPGVASGLVSKGVKLLALYTPPGPEQAFRGHDTAGKVATAKGKPVIASGAAGKELAIAGGKGGARILLEKDNAGDAAASAGWLRLAAGAEVPEHAHAAEAELLYILAGAGEMTIDGEAFPVEAGMAVHLPAGLKHAFRVTGADEVTAVQFYAPGGPEQRFKGTK